ncbi:hypothetical protein MMC21_005418 [Puttea exsequens]|nr:hypothetical protein [Puttea exsequens]
MSAPFRTNPSSTFEAQYNKSEMTFDAISFLAATVLNDGKIVSYRSLSREFKLHSNTAKKLLYDFHQSQASKKPGSVHAIYLLNGVANPDQKSRVSGQETNGEDVQMQSSPCISSSMPQTVGDEEGVPTSIIILAREEDLQAAKAKIDRVDSIHIYSLAPSTTQNLQILSECNREVSTKHIGEDPLIAGKQYGVIQNANVRRRTGRQVAHMPSAAAVVSVGSKASARSQESSKGNGTSASPFDRPSLRDNVSLSTSQPEMKSATTEKPKTSGREAAAKSAVLKREQSDLFKAFSTSQTKLKKENSVSSTEDSPAPGIERHPIAENIQQEEPMNDASEDEHEDVFADVANDLQLKSSRSRAEQHEQLRRMMDDEEDEETEELTSGLEEVSQDSKPIDEAPIPKRSSPEPTDLVAGGRRKGRRKVMKKKTTKDEEGYLVTKEEPTWESFSEDEPPARKDRTPVSTASSLAGKSKRVSGRPEQGNIMFFFGKK